MSGVRRISLAVLTVLVIQMIVADPHQAHRPPELRTTGITVANIAALTA